jgi:phospholipid/cholesterol/gamma-HCH transport system substrate-binding protein
VTRATRTFLKVATFGSVMLLLTTFLFFILGQYRTGDTNGYTAVFADASRLKNGDSVRVAGVRVGTVEDVSMRPDLTVLVKFDTDRDIVLTTGTTAAVRYLNLVGDRYLELADAAGSTRIMLAGAQIPLDRTIPALDLDALLGGLKPVIRGLNPKDVNALTASLLQILQGQDGTVDSLVSKTSSFTNAVADNSQAVEALIDNLSAVAQTLSQQGDQFSGAIDRLQKLISGLAADRDPIGQAFESLSQGTASLSDLLTQARAPLAGTITQLGRLAPLLDSGKDDIDSALQHAPENYRKLARLGSYGSFLQYYMCGLSLRVSDLQGRTVVLPWNMSNAGRCGEP